MAANMEVDVLPQQEPGADNVGVMAAHAGVVAQPAKCTDTIENFADSVSFLGVLEYFDTTSNSCGTTHPRSDHGKN